MIDRDEHMCWPPFKARNGTRWSCDECGQLCYRADGKWKLTGQ